MLGRPIITRQKLRELLDAGLTQREAANRLGVSEPAVCAAVKRFDLRSKGAPPRQVSDQELVLLEARLRTARRIAAELRMSESNVKMRLAGIPLLRREEILREVAAETADAPAMPPHPFWTPARDAIVLRSGGSWAGLRDAAKFLGKSAREVEARWHRLRAR